MNSRTVNITTILAFAAILFLLAGCNYTNNNDAAVSVPSIIVRNLPPSAQTVSLEISADDMDTITIEDINFADGSYTVEVPAGTDRLFSLVITPPSDSAVISYMGETTADLTAGDTVAIDITMSIDETKLIIPDAENNRVILKTSLTSGDWTERNGTFFNYSNNFDFFPYDADIDGSGNFYIGAADLNSSLESGVFKLDGFSDVTPVRIITDDVRALTIDRENDLIYYADNTGFIYKHDLDGNPLQSYNLSAIEITGMAYGGGFVYVLDWDTPILHKYNPSGAGSFAGSYSTDLISFWNIYAMDVMYKNGKVYVSNSAGTAGLKILELDANLNLLDNFGSYPSDPDNPIQDEFYYPSRFIAVLNRKFTLIDESYSTPVVFRNRVVSFSDLLGSDWEVYGSGGSGVDQFLFFNDY